LPVTEISPNFGDIVLSYADHINFAAMKTRFSACFWVSLVVSFSCSKQEDFPLSETEAIRRDFLKTSNRTSLKGVDFGVDWGKPIVQDGVFYLPMTVPQDRLHVRLDDSTTYSLHDKLWLKVVASDQKRSFMLLTLYPDNLDDWSESGTIFLEDWETGKLSHLFYHENKVVRVDKPHGLQKMSSASKAAMAMWVDNCVTKWVKACVYDHCQWRETTSCDWEFVDDGSEMDFPPGITGGGGTWQDDMWRASSKPSAGAVKKQIKDKPFALLEADIPCEVVQQWLETAPGIGILATCRIPTALTRSIPEVWIG